MTRRNILLLCIALLGTFVTAFILLNAVDYYRYHNAIWRLENLTSDQLRALGDSAAKIYKFERTSDPQGFDILNPIGVTTLAPNTSDLLLYELKSWHPKNEDDRIYLYTRINTSPSNQTISYYTNSDGKQRSKILWNRDPEFVRKHSPSGRILTITQWSRSKSLKWIILSNKILLIQDNGFSGGEPVIVDDISLNAAGLTRIKTALQNLPESFKGRVYQADGVLDGINLHISFDPDGESRNDDIVISNTWVNKFRPLLTTVSELGPKSHPLEFIEFMAPKAHLSEYSTTVRTLEEQDKIEWGEPNTPWWCVWRRWLK